MVNDRWWRLLGIPEPLLTHLAEDRLRRPTADSHTYRLWPSTVIPAAAYSKDELPLRATFRQPNLAEAPQALRSVGSSNLTVESHTPTKNGEVVGDYGGSSAEHSNAVPDDL